MLTTPDLLLTKGYVFDIHRFSIHDGPGIRTTVFLKGCPLSCVWCHNPESQSNKPEKIVRVSLCIKCGACVEVCPVHGISINDSRVVTDLSRCTVCGTCVEVCATEASEIVGEETSAADLAQLIQRDRVFYDESGGGVTFSGGEPLVQVRFLQTVMASVHTMGIQTALDTCGYAHWEAFLKVLPFTDLILFDIKVLDDQKHKQFTGVSNQLILDNLQKLNQQGKKIWLRFPVIPGINDDMDNLNAIMDLAKLYPHIERLSLLPYHNAAVKKYEGLGLNYCLDDIKSPTETRMDELAGWFQQLGLPAVVRG